MESAGRARIVVADDHPGVLATATSLLSERFDVVASTSDGQTALTATLALRPDAVVLDIAMPGLDGFQTAARLREANCAARIVFFSSHAGDDIVLEAVSGGAAGFVDKNRMGLDLLEAIGHALADRTFVPSAAVLPRWARPAGHRHDLQIYSTDMVVVGAVTAYFDGALQAGHSIIAVASDAHLRGLDVECTRQGIDMASLVAAGRYTPMDSTVALEMICRNGQPDPGLLDAAFMPLVEQGLAASTAPTPHVSIFGEMAPILCARGAYAEMIRLEEIAGDFEAAHPVSILCGYSKACLEGGFPDATAKICAAHSTIVADARHRYL